MTVKNLLDAPALHLSANGFYVVHPGGVPVVEYVDSHDAVRAYYALCFAVNKPDNVEPPNAG
jgi:hypothetical protein